MSLAPLMHILYLEDDADRRTVAQIALETVGGFVLRSCASGQEALEALEALEAVAGGYRPDLMLLDVMMPGMDGPCTLAGLRQLQAAAHTPVMFMTAKVQSTEVSYYQSRGALGVPAEPFDPMQLAQQVRSLWECRT